MSDIEAKALKDRQFADEALCWLPDVTRYALSLSLSRSEPDADDLVQETFLKAYTAWSSYEAGTECRGWLFTICRNVFLRGHRRDQRQIACEDAELEALAAAGPVRSIPWSTEGPRWRPSSTRDIRISHP